MISTSRRHAAAASLLTLCLCTLPGGVEGARSEPPPAVILLIGDGMGRGQLEAASYIRTGTPDGLYLHDLPVRGAILPVGIDGPTDSAAAATAMACGIFTRNRRIGMDPEGRRLENLVELAHRKGWAAGIVTTASISHSTPAAFSAHADSRHDYLGIARQQALESRPEVMLGGGAEYFLREGEGSLRSDGGLLRPLHAAGYAIVTRTRELRQLMQAPPERTIGLFARGHVPYEVQRRMGAKGPSLPEMTAAALHLLERHPRGFFLMIEGARIDMAAHGNHLTRMIGEVVMFDHAVQLATEWARRRGNATVIVTADHETGGLSVTRATRAGQLPEVSWRTARHTDQSVPVFGFGPGSEFLDGELTDHRWVHALVRSRIEGGLPHRPPPIAGVPVLPAAVSR